MGGLGRDAMRYFVLGVGLVGCSPSEVVVQEKLEPSHERLMNLGRAYLQYNSKYEKAPAGFAQLQPFLKEFGNPEEYLRSPTDGEPYVICWGVNLLAPPKWAKSTPILAYEKRGANGQRYVLTIMRSVLVMSDSEFRQASIPPGHQPPRGG